MSFLARVLKSIAGLGIGGNVGCIMLWLDEPEMPRSIIEK